MFIPTVCIKVWVTGETAFNSKQNINFCHVPADLGTILYTTPIIDLQVIIVTVIVELQVEGVKGQPDQVARGYVDVPGTVDTMRVAGGVAGASDGACGTGQGLTTAWSRRKGTTCRPALEKVSLPKVLVLPSPSKAES